LIFTLFFILIAWAFFVYNTEAIISANQPGQSMSWQFGQVRQDGQNRLISTIDFGLDFASDVDAVALGQHDPGF